MGDQWEHAGDTRNQVRDRYYKQVETLKKKLKNTLIRAHELGAFMRLYSLQHNSMGDVSLYEKDIQVLETKAKELARKRRWSGKSESEMLERKINEMRKKHFPPKKKKKGKKG